MRVLVACEFSGTVRDAEIERIAAVLRTYGGSWNYSAPGARNQHAELLYDAGLRASEVEAPAIGLADLMAEHEALHAYLVARLTKTAIAARYSELLVAHDAVADHISRRGDRRPHQACIADYCAAGDDASCPQAVPR